MHVFRTMNSPIGRIANYPVVAMLGAACLWAAAAATGVALTSGASAQVSGGGLPTSIGIAAKVVREVKGKRGAYVRKIALRDEVYQNERIVTGPGAAAEIVLRDNTRISLGPKSSLVLDKFVFDPVPTRRKVVISAVGGVFRFATGNSPSNTYRIKTASATLGIRGTIFTLIVAFNGAVTVSVDAGAVLFANLIGDSVLVTPGLSSSVQPPAPDGRQRPPSEPGPPPTPVTSTAQLLETTLAETELTDLAALETGEAVLAAPGEAAPGAVVPGTVGTTTGAGGAGTLEGVPAKALLGALSGSPDGIRALNEYLQEGAADPETVARRAVSVVRALKETPAGESYDLLVAAADRIAEAASNIFNTGAIMRLTVDDAFEKPDGSFAFDLQPPDGDVGSGWEEVLPRDERLAGVALRGLHRPGGDPVTTDGILGVEAFNIDVPNDMWRVIVLTEDLGTRQAGEDAIAYFGDVLQINDQAIELRKTNPEDWSQTAFLTNEMLDVGLVKSVGGELPASAASGLVGNVATRQAGVVVSETEVVNNAVALQFLTDQPSNQRRRQTYVTGVIIEPIEEESSIKGFPNLARFLDLESLITQAITDILTDVEPEAGEPDEDLFKDDGESPSPA